MCSWHHREDAGIHDPEVVRSVHDQVRVDDATQIQGQHGRGARVVVFGSYASLQDGTQFIRGRILGNVDIRRLQGLDRGGVENALIELHGKNHDVVIQRIDQPPWIHGRRRERVGRCNMRRPAGQRSHQGQVEPTRVVVQVLKGWDILRGQFVQNRGQLLLKASLEGRLIRIGRGVISVSRLGGCQHFREIVGHLGQRRKCDGNRGFGRPRSGLGAIIFCRGLVIEGGV